MEAESRRMTKCLRQEGVPLMLILMKGHPGSGKSSIARCLSEQMHIPLIDKDDARDCLTILQSTEIAEVELNALSYEIMWRYAKTQLLCRNSVIVDCPLARIGLFHQGRHLASQMSARIVVVECIAADSAVWQSRLEARALSDGNVSLQHKPSSWADLQALIKRYSGSERWSVDGTTDVDNYIRIDTTTGGNPAEIASGVIEALISRGLFPQGDESKVALPPRQLLAFSPASEDLQVGHSHELQEGCGVTTG